MSRLRTFLLFAALIALATAFTACGGSGGGDSGADPQTVVDNATLRGIESGDLDLAISLDARGDGGGKVDVSLSGPFQNKGGESQFPQVSMTARAKGSIGGENVDFEGGLTLLSNSAYVNYDGTEYEVDATTFSFVKSAIQQSQQQNNAQSQIPDVTACQEAIGNLRVADFIDNLRNDGTADVGGTGTTHVSGDLNISGALDSVGNLSDDPACSSQLDGAGGLPSKSELNDAKDSAKRAIKTATVDVYVGDDNIVRRISAQLKVEPEESGDGPRSADFSFDLTIDGVNEDQTIEAPGGAKPLNDLFLKLDVNPLELLGAAQGGAGAPDIGGLLGGLGGGSGSDNSGSGNSGSGSGSGGGSGGSGSSGSGSSGSAPSGVPDQQAYLDCLRGARTPVDLQNCAKLLQ